MGTPTLHALPLLTRAGTHKGSFDPGWGKCMERLDSHLRFVVGMSNVSTREKGRNGKKDPGVVVEFDCMRLARLCSWTVYCTAH